MAVTAEPPEDQADKGGLAASPPPPPGDFPIAGESRWVNVMRALAFGTLLTLIAMAGVFHFLGGDDSFLESQQIGMIMGGIVFILVAEYFIFLNVVVPRQADYGRYEIFQDRVIYYPLTALGLSVAARGVPERIEKFTGIATGVMTGKRGARTYGVFLVHMDQKGRTINLQGFDQLADAESYAVEIAKKLRLNAISGTRKKQPPASGAAARRGL